MRRYRVRYLPEASEALRRAFLFIKADAGPGRAAAWLREVYASIDDLESLPRAARAEGTFEGREFRSKLVVSHRVFFTIDDEAEMVFVIDVVHTRQQTRLDEYTDQSRYSSRRCSGRHAVLYSRSVAPPVETRPTVRGVPPYTSGYPADGSRGPEPAKYASSSSR